MIEESTCVIDTENENPYEAISDLYAGLVGEDPSKRFVQFPWALAQLAGKIRGARILDIGCGEGLLARILAQQGATVLGYDPAPSQIDLARRAEAEEPLGIQYLLAAPRDIVGEISSRRFDVAVAVTVLHYAADLDHLSTFFSSTYQLLEPGGMFVALVTNPDFKRFGVRAYNRLYSREPDGTIRVDFFKDGQLSCSAGYVDFSRADYEAAAAAAGWSSTLEWLPVGVTKEGVDKLGDFWEGFEDDCPYAGFRIAKPISDV